MKIAHLLTGSLPLVAAFQGSHAPSRPLTATSSSQSPTAGELSLPTVAVVVSRQAFLFCTAALGAGALLSQPQAAAARGRATLEQSYERYVPRIAAGGEFYGKELRALVGAGDWAGIKKALADVPERRREDLSKPDAGVAERARQAGGFSDARVLTAADLFAGAFSDNSVSTKTKKMKTAIEKVRTAVEGMQSVARQALGEDGGGGFFGLGKKQPNEAELKKKLREYYVYGGNAWNEYILAANEDLALKFDRLAFIR